MPDTTFNWWQATQVERPVKGRRAEAPHAACHRRQVHTIPSATKKAPNNIGRFAATLKIRAFKPGCRIDCNGI